jgi:hypothetical protein
MDSGLLMAKLQNQPKPPQKRGLGKRLGIAVDNSPYTFPTKTRQCDFPALQDPTAPLLLPGSTRAASEFTIGSLLERNLLRRGWYYEDLVKISFQGKSCYDAASRT